MTKHTEMIRVRIPSKQGKELVTCDSALYLVATKATVLRRNVFSACIYQIAVLPGSVGVALGVSINHSYVKVTDFFLHDRVVIAF